jgi:type IV pilus assembly protein PilX
MITTTATWVAQKGMALIISLIILLSMTLLGLAAMQNTSLQERMAGNMRAENIAFQAAEAALRAGEQALIDAASQPSDNGTNFFKYDGRPCECLDWDSKKWTDNGVEVRDLKFATLLGEETADDQVLTVTARYAIKEDAAETGQSGSLVVGHQQLSTAAYRVIGWGRDAAGRSHVLLGSKFKRGF